MRAVQKRAASVANISIKTRVLVPAPVDPRVRVPLSSQYADTCQQSAHAPPPASRSNPHAPRAFAHAPHIQAAHAHSGCTRTTHTISTLRALTPPTPSARSARSHFRTHTHHPHTHSHTHCTRKLRSAYAPPAPPAALTQSAYACIIDHSMMHAIRRRRPWKRKGKRAQSRSTPQRFR